jgi:hypothetical protein
LFRRGRTMACFCGTGSKGADRVQLHMRASTSASTNAAFFTNQVGSGSRSQCFRGTLPSMSRISLSVALHVVRWPMLAQTQLRRERHQPSLRKCQVIGW